MTVVGLSLFLGLAVPYFIGKSPITIESAKWLSDILNGILGTSMAVGGVVAILCDRILPGRDKEIKIEAAEQVTTGA